MSLTGYSPEEEPLRMAHRARHAAAPDVVDVPHTGWPDTDGASHVDDEYQMLGWPTAGRAPSAHDRWGEGADVIDDDSSAPVSPALPGFAGPTVTLDTLPAPHVEPEAAQAEEEHRKPRAGRNLPAAIGVGLVLGGLVLASLLVWKPAFNFVVVLAIVVATVEMVFAVRAGDARPPLVPLLIGGPLIAALAWYGGAEALPYGLLGTAVAVMVWRLAEGPTNYQRDVVAALLIAVYVPFLAGFAILLAAPSDGHLRVLATFVAVVLSDTGGYAVGVFLGRRPMAPSVSPKKSWEGFGGSLAVAGIGSAVLLSFTLGAAWWHGLLFGVAVAGAATLGDLAESLLKRDLGIKDMSNLLPGHGGLMDRLDSLLVAMPIAYAALTVLVPPG